MRKLLPLLLALVWLHACSPDDETPDPDSYSHKVGVGLSAQDLISEKQYKYLIVEMQFMPGQRPTDRAIADFKTFLEETVDKPRGIELRQKDIASGEMTSYPLDEIRAIEDRNREFFTSGDTIATYFLFADGDYAKNNQNSITLGIAHRNTSMALFQKTIQDGTGGLGKPRQDVMETTVLCHEFGHILGLVNLNDDMVSYHEDLDNHGHCDNKECLMYWTVGGGRFTQDLVGRQVAPPLDDACKMDLEARR